MELYTIEGFKKEDIEHWGIKGQKWGVRRYQNPDGSLTPEGKKRYGTVENFEAARHQGRRRFRTAALATAAIGSAVALAGYAAKATPEQLEDFSKRAKSFGDISKSVAGGIKEVNSVYKDLTMTQVKNDNKNNNNNPNNNGQQAVDKVRNVKVNDILKNPNKYTSTEIREVMERDRLTKQLKDAKESENQNNQQNQFSNLSKVKAKDVLKHPENYTSSEIQEVMNRDRLVKQLDEQNNPKPKPKEEEVQQVIKKEKVITIEDVNKHPSKYTAEEIRQALERERLLNQVYEMSEPK